MSATAVVAAPMVVVVVNDDAVPFEGLDVFTEEDLKTVSLGELYRRSCRHLRVKCNDHVLRQLPETPSGRPHFSVSTLNLSGSYLGNRGVAALIPVLDACPRLTHLFLSGVGLKVDVAKTLIAHIRLHNGIQALDLSRNDLGTDVGLKLLRLVEDHKRIFSLAIDETLIIPQIKKKIDAQLKRNESIRNQFSLPLIPDEAEDNEVVVARKLREAEDRERRRRAEMLRREEEDRLPTWAPSALGEFAFVLQKHRRYLENVFSVFTPAPQTTTATTGSASSSLMSREALCTTVDGFKRGMKILGITSLSAGVGGTSLQQSTISELESTIRVEEFACWFGAYDPEAKRVYVGTIISALRVHAMFSSSANPGGESIWVPPTRELQRALDKLYDIRDTLLSSLEQLDMDMSFRVPLSAFASGIASILRDAPTAVALVDRYVEWSSAGASKFDAVALDGTTDFRIAVADGKDVEISYHEFFDALLLSMKDTDEPSLAKEQSLFQHATKATLRGM